MIYRPELEITRMTPDLNIRGGVLTDWLKISTDWQNNMPNNIDSSVDAYYSVPRPGETL